MKGQPQEKDKDTAAPQDKAGNTDKRRQGTESVRPVPLLRRHNRGAPVRQGSAWARGFGGCGRGHALRAPQVL